MDMLSTACSAGGHMHSTTDLCRFLYKFASALAMALLTCTYRQAGVLTQDTVVTPGHTTSHKDRVTPYYTQDSHQVTSYHIIQGPTNRTNGEMELGQVYHANVTLWVQRCFHDTWWHVLR